jgi:hypothetical protein
MELNKKKKRAIATTMTTTTFPTTPATYRRSFKKNKN